MNDTEADPDQSDAIETPEPEPPDPTGIPRSRLVRLSELVTEFRYWRNPRSVTGLGDDELRDLAASITRLSTQVLRDEDTEQQLVAGILDPLKVVMIDGPNSAVVNLVIDGQRRYRAAEIAFKDGVDPLIPVIDREPVPVTWTQEMANRYLLESLETVATREGLSSFELSESADQLRKSRDPDTGKDYTLAKIAQAIGRSESWVSKILKARSLATPKLLHQWQTGEITDEQFKDLAEERDPERQRAAAEEVGAARAVGDKSSSRVLAKEYRAKAQEAKPAKPEATGSKRKAEKAPTAKGAPKAVVRGPQAELPVVPPAPPPRKPPSFAVIEDFVGMAKKRPPTHDYVKGLMDGASWASGLKDAAEFGKPWQAYSARVAGESARKPAKPAKKASKPARRPKKR